MPKLAIIGSRTFSDHALLERSIYTYFGCVQITEVISGGAAGADRHGATWANEHRIKLTEFIPDWNKYGRSAGFRRNEDIIAASDMVLCMWDGVSKGSGNSLSIAKRLKKPTVIIYF